MLFDNFNKGTRLTRPITRCVRNSGKVLPEFYGGVISGGNVTPNEALHNAVVNSVGRRNTINSDMIFVLSVIFLAIDAGLIYSTLKKAFAAADVIENSMNENKPSRFITVIDHFDGITAFFIILLIILAFVFYLLGRKSRHSDAQIQEQVTNGNYVVKQYNVQDMLWFSGGDSSDDFFLDLGGFYLDVTGDTYERVNIGDVIYAALVQKKGADYFYLIE